MYALFLDIFRIGALVTVDSLGHALHLALLAVEPSVLFLLSLNPKHCSLQSENRCCYHRFHCSGTFIAFGGNCAVRSKQFANVHCRHLDVAANSNSFAFRTIPLGATG